MSDPEPQQLQRPQKPLELILARNLLTSLSTPAFLLDNTPRSSSTTRRLPRCLGRSFEDAGRMEADQWTRAFGPLEKGGSPVEVDALATTDAIRARPARPRANSSSRPARAKRSRSRRARSRSSPEKGSSGAMILFWPLSPNGAGND